MSTIAAIAHAVDITVILDYSYPAVLEVILAMTFTDGRTRLENTVTLQRSLTRASHNIGSMMPSDGLWVDKWVSYRTAFQIDE
jgi:hypothetical protein